MAEAGVAVKLPQFSRRNLGSWFETAEAQFTIAMITADEIKYSHVLLAIDETTEELLQHLSLHLLVTNMIY